MTAPIRSHTKGASFRAFSEYVDRELGRDATLGVFAKLSPHLRSWIDPDDPVNGIVMSTWYPSELLTEILAFTFDPLPEKERARLLREGTRYAAEQVLHGVYRMLFRVAMTPERLASRIQPLWRANNDTGDVTWSVDGPGRIRSEVRNWLGHDRYRCEINRYSEIAILQLLGLKNVDSRNVLCIDRGDDRCGSLMTFRV